MRIQALDSEDKEYLSLVEMIGKLVPVDLYGSFDEALEDQSADHEAFLFDIDQERKLHEKEIKKLRKKYKGIKIFAKFNDCSKTELIKHQNSKVGADLYFKTPVQFDFVRLVIDQFFDLGLAEKDRQKYSQEEVLKAHKQQTVITENLQGVSASLDELFSSVYPLAYQNIPIEDVTDANSLVAADVLKQSTMLEKEIFEMTDPGITLSGFDLSEDEDNSKDVIQENQVPELKSEQEHLAPSLVLAQENSINNLNTSVSEIDLGVDLVNEPEGLLVSSHDDVIDANHQSDDVELEEVGAIDLELSNFELGGEEGDSSNDGAALDLDIEDDEVGGDGVELDLSFNRPNVEADQSSDFDLSFDESEDKSVIDLSSDDIDVNLKNKTASDLDIDDGLVFDDSIDENQIDVEFGLSIGEDTTEDGFELSLDEETFTVESPESLDEHIPGQADAGKKEQLEEFSLEDNPIDDDLMLAEDELSFNEQELVVDSTAEDGLELSLENTNIQNNLEANDELGDEDEILEESASSGESGFSLDDLSDDDSDNLENLFGDQPSEPDQEKIEVNEPTNSMSFNSDILIPAEPEDETHVFIMPLLNPEPDITQSVEACDNKPIEQVSDTASQRNENISEDYTRLAETIRALRDDREELLGKIVDLENNYSNEKRDFLGLQAQVEEKNIEITVIKKRYEKEIEELKSKLHITEQKKEFLKHKTMQVEKEVEKLSRKQHVDINKVRTRERELEDKLEMLKTDAEVQLRNRDHKILELKRRVDTLEFDIESTSMKEKASALNKMELEDKMEQVISTLRGAIGQLEEKEENIKIENIKKSVDQ